MAPGLSRWVAGTLAACAVVAVAFLPAQPREHEFTFWWLGYGRSPEFRRAYLLDLALRRARTRLANAERSEALARRAGERRGTPTLDVSFRGDVSPQARDQVRRVLDTAWATWFPGQRRLGVVVQVDGAVGPGIYRLPASGESTPCAANIALGVYAPADARQRAPDWFLTGAIAPCIYYAAFGPPGAGVDSWLRHRRFDVIATPPRPDVTRSLPGERPGPLGTLFRDAFFISRQYVPTAGIACARGRLDICRDRVLRDVMPVTRDAAESLGGPYVVVPRFYWFDLTWLVSDLVGDMGPERFATFWTSPLPVDSAFATAFGVELGEWMSGWQRRQMGGRVPPPTAPSLVMTLQALFLVVAAVGIAAAVVTRRQAR